MCEHSRHIPVLLKEVIEALGAQSGGYFLDCTLGGAGHSAGILAANPHNQLLAIDRDSTAIERAKMVLADQLARVELRQGSFSKLIADAPDYSFDGILADLGMSTDQLFAQRGFSFHDNGALDMRMDPSQGQSAADVLNSFDSNQLALIFRQGGVRGSLGAVLSAIERAKPIESAAQFAALIARARSHQRDSHPATVFFQALRIFVNQEFAEIDALLQHAPRVLKRGGRLCVITFHSLEDKLVAQAMRKWAQGDTRPARLGLPRDKVIGRMGKTLTASAKEISDNPAARSAKLRTFIKEDA